MFFLSGEIKWLMLCNIFDKPILNKNSVKAFRVKSIFLERDMNAELHYLMSYGEEKEK